MKIRCYRFLLLGILGLAVVACQVDEKKIELWKSTKSGPAKLAETVADTKIEASLRAKAIVALSEIKQHGLLTETLRKMDDADRDRVLEKTIPLLVTLIKDGQPEDNTLLASQITAKDGLYLVYDYTGDRSRQAAQQALVDWCVEGNFNVRANAGFTISAIAEKVGPPIAEGIAKKLDIDQPAIKSMAQLIKSHADEDGRVLASTTIADELEENIGKFSEQHLTAAAIIGGESVGTLLVKLATDTALSEELQRYALRAYSVALDDDNIVPTDAQLTRLIAMASNEQTDRYQREETWMTIAQISRPAATQAMETLLSDDVFFWRLVGVRCLLRQDGEKNLAAVLAHSKLATSRDELLQIVDVVSKFPDLTAPLIAVAETNNGPFARGVALYAIRDNGVGHTVVDKLKALVGDRQRLPRAFPDKTVGTAATTVIKALEQKGN